MITLMVISEREETVSKLQAYFSEQPTIRFTNKYLDNFKFIPDKLGELHPDILLVDAAISNRTISVTDLLYAIRTKDATSKIILLHDQEISGLINKIIRFNVVGLIASDASCEMYRKGIRIVHEGELWMPNFVISEIFDFLSEQYRHTHSAVSNFPTLSLREQSIAKFVAQGLTNKEITRKLKVSPETIKKHLKNIFYKAGARKRSELASM